MYFIYPVLEQKITKKYIRICTRGCEVSKNIKKILRQNIKKLSSNNIFRSLKKYMKNYLKNI